ncbi:MAG: hypothetical protein AAF170_00280 [Bacteroidota bacterium]
MSIQELKEAVFALPLDQRSALLAEVAAELQRELAAVQGEAGAAESLRKRRRALADAAAPHWRGGGGLEYQHRTRSEWGSRETMP